MQLFYILVFVAGLLVAQLLIQAIGTAVGTLRGFRRGADRSPFERRMPFLSEDARLCLASIEEALGEGYLVLAKVSLSEVLQPEEGIGRRRQARAAGQLRGTALDYMICSVADSYPLCAVIAAQGKLQPKQAQRRAKMIDDMCAAAGLPLVTLELQDRYELSELRRRLLDAIDTVDMSLGQTPDPPAADEEALLAELAASMQDADGNSGRRIAARR